MTPERMAELVGQWVRLYTRDLPDPVAQRRVDEIDADLHDHIVHERDHGTHDRRVALGVLSRMVRGLSADASWREDQVRTNLDHPATLEAAIKTRRRTYRTGVGVAVASGLLLYWIIGAVGLIGAVIAIIAGKHEDPVTSLPELVGLNAFFIALFVGSARLFGQAARYQPPPQAGPNR
jgi:hypothetical protein